MTSKKHSIWYLIITMIVFGALLLAGCDSKSVLEEETAPDGSTVSVTASPSTVTTTGTSVVEATVVANSSGVPNQVVTFTVSPSNAGYFSPAIDTTDANGVAATVFTATTSGSATVSCSVGGTTLTGNTAMTINSSSQTGGSGNIDMSLSQTLLLANGNDTTQVTINVRDANGQPAPDSTLVTLVAGERFVDLDQNGTWSPGSDSLVFDPNANGTWDAIGIIQSTGYTTGGTGSLTVNYISGNDAATVYIKASVNDNGIVGSVELPVQVSPNTAINSIFLASDSINLVVKQTGGTETAMLTASGFDEFGNPLPEGLTISFIITDGPGGGEHLGNTGYGPFIATTNSQGLAMAPLSSGTASGTIRIRAYADTVLSNATQVLVSAGPPAQIVVGAEDCNVPYWYTVAEFVEIVAVIQDVYNNPVGDSTVVYFTADEGTMKSHEGRTQDLEGIAGSKWISGDDDVTADGIVYVIAETAGGTVVDTVAFINSSYTASITASVMPTSMVADGATKVTVYVEGLDVNGNPVDDGTEFSADAGILKVSGGVLEDGCYGSSARTKITSATLEIDNSTPGGNDDGIGGTDIVEFWSGIGYVAYPVTLTTGLAYSGNSTINGQSSAAAGEVVNLSAAIKDRWGNPLGDHTLVMTASIGSVAGATQETDAYGEANGFTWTAPGGVGTATITITDTDPRGGIIITTQIDYE